VGIVRLLSAAEIDSFRINHRYATFAELVKSNQLTHTVMESPEHFSAFRSLNLQSDSEPVLGYLLELIVAPDGASYKLSLTRKAVNCAPGLFTDEKGILYEGKPVDCAAEEQALASVPSWAEADSGKAISLARTDVSCSSSARKNESTTSRLAGTGKRAPPPASSIMSLKFTRKTRNTPTSRNIAPVRTAWKPRQPPPWRIQVQPRLR
jgi:hypothetical protein